MNSHSTTNTANNGANTPARDPTHGTNRGEVTPSGERDPQEFMKKYSYAAEYYQK